ncbi:UNVERIFIED_CONTAM: hypothetical protein FKN15_029455, partial [Acipenser sinensis]
VELVNIGGADIVDGNHKLTLGLIWSIILHWQVKDVMKNIMAGLQQTNSEKILLSWVRQSTQDYQEVNVVNFTNSWSDGLAFNALIHSHRALLACKRSHFLLQLHEVKDVMKNIMAGLQQTNSEKILLSWVRQSTQDYQEVNVVNFTNSWSDGLAFNALIHSHRPDLFEWSSVLKYQSAIEKLDHAFSTAKQHLDIEKLLDPEGWFKGAFSLLVYLFPLDNVRDSKCRYCIIRRL